MFNEHGKSICLEPTFLDGDVICDTTRLRSHQVKVECRFYQIHNAFILKWAAVGSYRNDACKGAGQICARAHVSACVSECACVSGIAWLR